MITLPVHVSQKIKDIKKAHEILLDGGSYPTLKGLSERSGYSEAKIVELTRSWKSTISLDTRIGTGEDVTLMDLIANNPDVFQTPHKFVEAEETRENIHRLLQVLDPKEREVVERRYGFGNHEENLTLRTIGMEMGYSREYIRHIHDRALKKLRKLIPDASFNL